MFHLDIHGKYPYVDPYAGEIDLGKASIQNYFHGKDQPFVKDLIKSFKIGIDSVYAGKKIGPRKF